MKFLGISGTIVSLIVAGFVQVMPDVDELVKFLAWAVPGTISLLSWGMQLFMTAKRMKKVLLDEVMKSINKSLADLEPQIAERVVDEVWNRIDTINGLIKRKDEKPVDTTAGETKNE